jgi:porin
MNRSLSFITLVMFGPLPLLKAGETAAATSNLRNEAAPFSEHLFGDWGGLRASLADVGVKVKFDGTYSLQNVANGGLPHGHDYGSVYSSNLGMVLDTGKAGLWPGGFLTMRVEGRVGESVLSRAGTTSPVNNDALFPLIPGSIDTGGFGLTELTYAQFLSKEFGVVLGLLNGDTADANPIAGFMGSNDYFMNLGMLASPVIIGTAPTVTLGGGLVFLPSETNHIKFLVLGTKETAGRNPFEKYEGTTFLGEWTTKYKLGGKPGGMTFTGGYSVGQERPRITDDPRTLIADHVAGGSLKSTEDSWSVMWNGFQYLSGGETGGWGLFGRCGLSDGDPSPIRWSGAMGIGGVGLIPGRDKDRWGVGVFHQDFTDRGVIAAAGIDSETGGELFYNIALCAGMNLTFSAQVIDSAIPHVDTTVVLGARMGFSF